MNNYFANIGEQLAGNLPLPVGVDIDFEDATINEGLEFSEVNKAVVTELLKELKPSKSCGIDRLTARLLKECKIHIVAPLLHNFNLSITHSVFPDTWKTSVVTPFFKDGKRDEANNYRPISIL